MSALPPVSALPSSSFIEVIMTIQRRSSPLPAPVSILVLVLTLIVSCSSEQPTHTPNQFGHVHGLGVNPADRKLYAATHTGVFVIEDGSARLIANRRQDTMGFTVVGPDEFLGSGHPATLDEPNPLGLIRTNDAAQSWKPVAFAGERDFHAIDAVGSETYAYSADSETLLRSRGDTWKTVARGGLLDIAVDPSDPNRVLAADFSGELVSYRAGSEAVSLDDAPAMHLIDWDPGGDLVGTGSGGKVWVSADAGETWNSRGNLPATAEALTVKSETWYAATSGSIHASADGGRTWTIVLDGR